MDKVLDRIVIDDQFIMRRPLKSIEDFNEMISANSLTRYLDEKVIDALLVASSDLLEEIERQKSKETGSKTESALYKYFMRMSTRCTPFGLFAGVSTGSFGEKEYFSFSQDYEKRVPRIDFGLLTLIMEDFIENHNGLSYGSLIANRTLLKVGDFYHYTFYQRNASGKRDNASKRIQSNELLDIVIRRTKTPVEHVILLIELVHLGLNKEQAEKYLSDLYKNNIIESSLLPSSLNGDPIGDRIASLKDCTSNSILPELAGIHSFNQYLTELGGIISSMKHTGLKPALDLLKDKLSQLGITHNSSRSIQFDCHYRYETLSLPLSIKDHFKKAYVLHSLLSDRENSDMTKFKKEFIKRYESSPIPLLQALDSDLGIGYGMHDTESNDPIELIQNIASAPHVEPNSKLSWFESFLLQKIINSNSASKIEIGLNELHLDINRLEAYPNHMSAIGSVIKEDGKDLLNVDCIMGTTGANYISRFAHLDDRIMKMTERYIHDIELSHPDSIVAEISHIPHDRLGNVMNRPLVTKYIIDYLGNSSSVPAGHVIISPDDIAIESDGRNIFLKSLSLNKKILPINSSTHNFKIPTNLPIYTFLCDMQASYPTTLSAKFGEYVSSLRHIPRIQIDEVILGFESWRIPSGELVNILSKPMEAIEKWRVDNKLPQIVTVVQGDNKIPIAFNNVIAQDTLRSLAEKAEGLRLQEFPSNLESYYQHSNGLHYANEFIVRISKN